MTKATLHLSIPVSDIAASVTFYQDLLGCRVTRVIADRADIDFMAIILWLNYHRLRLRTSRSISAKIRIL